MKTVLVTGGFGYLGRVLINKLVKNKYKVITIDPLIYNDNSREKINKNVTTYVGLTEDKYTLKKIFEKKIDYLIHLSGVSNDPTAALDPELTNRSNIEATKNILNFSKSSGVKKFIFASSCSVYGFTGNKDFVSEKNKLNPISKYAESKIECEKIILNENSKNFSVTCLRKATLYGASPRMRFDLVVNTMTGSAYQDKKIIINGGNQWRPFLHVEDAADLYIRLLELNSERISKQIFNVGSNELNLQIKDVAKIVSKIISNAKIINSKSFDNRSYKVNFDKISLLTGWKAKKNIDYGVKEIKNLFLNKKIKNFRDINYYNIKRLIYYLNI
jgi:nucleoside-diphosphate-sugar epimerase